MEVLLFVSSLSQLHQPPVSTFGIRRGLSYTLPKPKEQWSSSRARGLDKPLQIWTRASLLISNADLVHTTASTRGHSFLLVADLFSPGATPDLLYVTSIPMSVAGPAHSPTTVLLKHDDRHAFIMAEVYVFGDQTADCRAFFAKVFTRKDNILLQAFLEKAAFALQAELKQRSHASTAVPNFGTIQELVDRYYTQEAKDAGIESALVCISQFSHFIGYVKAGKRAGWKLTAAVPSRRSPNHIFHLIQMRD